MECCQDYHLSFFHQSDIHPTVPVWCWGHHLLHFWRSSPWESMPCNHWNMMVFSMLSVHLLGLTPQLTCSPSSSNLNNKPYWESGYLSLDSYLALILSCLLLLIYVLHFPLNCDSGTSSPPQQDALGSYRQVEINHYCTSQFLCLCFHMSVKQGLDTTSVTSDPSSNQLSEALNWAIFYFFMIYSIVKAGNCGMIEKKN